MSTVTMRYSLADDVPDTVTAKWCAQTFGITVTAVGIAIREGRLPAQRFGNLWSIRVEDAMALWATKLPRPTVTVDNNQP